ncbi:MAG: hypothetical protein E3K37_06285 [Candidatus Kuenenia sp.]|nr:hypothetical protein [Candidatus Kuenenia hertensis]
MKEIKNRLELLESDLKNLEKTIKNKGAYGTIDDWLHVLHKSRKIEEFAITQLAILKYTEKQNYSA